MLARALARRDRGGEGARQVGRRAEDHARRAGPGAGGAAQAAQPRAIALAAIAHGRGEATMPMKAIRGRASFLGERSIGHMDPGARSSALMIDAVCDVLERRDMRAMSASSSSRIRRRWPKAPPTWCARWSATRCRSPGRRQSGRRARHQRRRDHGGDRPGLVGGRRRHPGRSRRRRDQQRDGGRDAAGGPGAARSSICNAPIVEGAVMAATEASGGASLEAVKRTAEELSAR